MVISFLSSILIWGAVAVLIVRVLSASGIPLGKSRAVSILTADKSLGGGFEVTKADTAKVFGLAMAFRAAVFLISICAIYIFKEQEFSWKELLNTYLQWDANNYQRIAIGGYTYHMENGDFTTLAFFPLYPWMIRALTLILRNEIVSGILLSALLYSGACCYMYKLMAIDYSRSSAIRAIIYMSVFPHALFFGVMMNESTLLFMSMATLYYIRKHDWVKVGIFGALAALSRMAGILLAIPAAVEWLEHYEIFGKVKDGKIKEAWKLFYSKGLWIFLMLLGTGIYLFCNYKVTGDWFKFLEYQDKYWSNGSCYFGTGIAGIFERAVTETRFTRFAIWIPEAVSIAFVIAALIYGLRRNRSMYAAYLIIYIIINTGLDWPISTARYMTCAIPAFIFLSDFSERHRWTEPLITTSMAVAMGVYLTAYFMAKQIL